MPCARAAIAVCWLRHFRFILKRRSSTFAFMNCCIVRADCKIAANSAPLRNIGNSDCPQTSAARERNFWMQRQTAKYCHQNAQTPTETKIRKVSGPKSRQKRPFLRRTGNVRFATTGWWRQSGTNWRPTTQSSKPVSAAGPGTEICDAETGTQKPTYHLAETNPETPRSAKSPHSGAINAKRLAEV